MMDNLEIKKSWKFEEKENGKINILGYNGKKQEVIVPNEIDGKKVISVDFEAFGFWQPRVSDEQKAHRKTITSITFMDGIEKLGRGLFDGCESLTKICIPDSVNEIDNECFINCGKNANIELQSTNKNFVVENGILYDIDKLTLIYCFDKSINMTNVPESVKLIAGGAFSNCLELKEIQMGSNVEKIGTLAFSNCSNLNNINISRNVRDIDFGTFIDCKSLNSIILPENVTNINKDAFTGSGIKFIIAKGIVIKKSNPYYLQEVYGFAKAIFQNEELNEKIIKQNKKFINSNRKDLYRYSLIRKEILEYMMREKMIKKEEIEDIKALINQNPNVDNEILGKIQTYESTL